MDFALVTEFDSNGNLDRSSGGNSLGLRIDYVLIYVSDVVRVGVERADNIFKNDGMGARSAFAAGCGVNVEMRNRSSKDESSQ